MVFYHKLCSLTMALCLTTSAIANAPLPNSGLSDITKGVIVPYDRGLSQGVAKLADHSGHNFKKSLQKIKAYESNDHGTSQLVKTATIWMARAVYYPVMLGALTAPVYLPVFV